MTNHCRKQIVSPPHTAPDGFSPLFSNATTDHTPAGLHVAQPTAEQKHATRKRSEPNGDHHLAFVDLDDSVPVRPRRS